MIKVTDTAKWERTKNWTAYLTLAAVTAIFLYRYEHYIETPTPDLPTIALVLVLVRLGKTIVKEG
tara:strand:+ start:384 stop:578 length:195 start_codon:yes stop_codon:yes gene_type:complete